MSRPLATASALALTTLTACDDLRGPDYLGDVLAELKVTITDADGAVPSRPIFVGVSWSLSIDAGDATEFELPISGALPSTITLPIYKRPPLTDLYIDAPATDFRLGVGYLTASITDATGELVPIGMNQDHWVIFVPSAVPEGSFASKLLHGTPAPGYHIYARRELSALDRERRDRCYFDLASPTWEVIYEACGGHPHYHEIHLAPADLATPLSIDLNELLGVPELLWISI